MTPKFAVKIRRGQIFLDEPKRFKTYLLSFKDDTEGELIVKEVEETISDSDRKYYFKVVAGMIAEEVGHSLEVVHHNMKLKYSSHTDGKTGFTITESVFSNESKMPISKKKKFIKRVRDWASDFLNLDIPEKRRIDYD